MAFTGIGLRVLDLDATTGNEVLTDSLLVLTSPVRETAEHAFSVQ